MKFIFPILAILVCAAAAYFSLSQSEQFETYQTARLVAIDTNKNVTASADQADSKIDDEKALLETSKKNLEISIQSVLALQSTGNALKNESSKLDTELEAQDADLEELNKALAEVKKIFANLGLGENVDINNLAEKIAEIEEDIKGKRAKMEELDTLIDGAKTSLEGKQQEVVRLVERKDARNSRIGRNAMEARVTAVDNDWGFIVIGAGSNSGFTPQTSLLVKRDGRLIGKVSPSAIEPTQTIGEIEYKTLSPGVRIQPGDSVILAKPAAN
jgi:predicted RNase H-like nuclease (RuvC/YqgF family)